MYAIYTHHVVTHLGPALSSCPAPFFLVSHFWTGNFYAQWCSFKTSSASCYNFVQDLVKISLDDFESGCPHILTCTIKKSMNYLLNLWTQPITTCVYNYIYMVSNIYCPYIAGFYIYHHMKNGIYAKYLQQRLKFKFEFLILNNFDKDFIITFTIFNSFLSRLEGSGSDKY